MRFRLRGSGNTTLGGGGRLAGDVSGRLCLACWGVTSIVVAGIWLELVVYPMPGHPFALRTGLATSPPLLREHTPCRRAGALAGDVALGEAFSAARLLECHSPANAAGASVSAACALGLLGEYQHEGAVPVPAGDSESESSVMGLLCLVAPPRPMQFVVALCCTEGARV